MILFFFWLFYIYIYLYIFFVYSFGKNFTIISQDILSQIANMMQTTD